MSMTTYPMKRRVWPWIAIPLAVLLCCGGFTTLYVNTADGPAERRSASGTWTSSPTSKPAKAAALPRNAAPSWPATPKPKPKRTTKDTPRPTRKATTAPTEDRNEYYANCTAMRRDYPNGVRSGHPAYRSGLDRDRDGRACEVNR